MVDDKAKRYIRAWKFRATKAVVGVMYQLRIASYVIFACSVPQSKPVHRLNLHFLVQITVGRYHIERSVIL